MSNFSEIAQAGKDFACGLYKLQPGALVPTPFSSLLFAVWDDFCDYPNNPGLPLPPQEPFQGGQCGCIQYRVVIRLNETYTEGTFERDTGASLLGSIGATRIDVANGVTDVKVFARGVPNSPCLADPIFISVFSTANPPGYKMNSAKIVRIIREDGQIDNCGNPPPEFPPSPPPPPGGYTSPPTRITSNDGATYIDLNFNFSPPPPPAPFPKNFMPPVIINFNKVGADFKIPITFNFGGEFNFGGGGGNGDFNQDDRDNINNIKNVTNNTNNTTNNTNNNVNNFYSDYQKDRDRTVNKEPLPDDFEPPKPPEPPGKKLVERLAYVNVDLSVVPSNAKSQSGKGAPDVVYAGWFEFLRKGKSFPRDYIHFQNNCFIAPIGADGYAFTLYNGYQGSAVAVVFKE